jgi:SAM-dependent methyltransferase
VGTGRLAVPLTVAGHAVTGVDLDPAMLERARVRTRAQARAGEAGPGDDVGHRLDLIEADIVDLHLSAAGTFGLAFIALNSLLLLATRSAQQAAIRTMAEHLAPGGLAVVDVWIPDAEDLARYDGRISLEWPRLDPETGATVTKAGSAQHDAASATITVTTIFEEGRQGAPANRWVRRDRLRLVSADELRGFAEAAGLVIELVAGDYGLGPLGPGSERAILIAVKP